MQSATLVYPRKQSSNDTVGHRWVQPKPQWAVGGRGDSVHSQDGALDLSALHRVDEHIDSHRLQTTLVRRRRLGHCQVLYISTGNRYGAPVKAPPVFQSSGLLQAPGRTLPLLVYRHTNALHAVRRQRFKAMWFLWNDQLSE
ncbi:hypothetical protein [Nocardia sp. R7R-8]|uniref:hypothetical protein n=1 Tax=Nocardia sp. R7R-8 TaxID=3459304 RepID=UPI00403DBAE5